MKTFTCECNNTLYFDNTQCLSCGRTVGFAWDINEMLSSGEPAFFHAATNSSYRLCKNAERGLCNCLVPSSQTNAFCRSCELSRVVPDLSVPDNVAKLEEVERAKRRVLFALLKMGLDVPTKQQDPSAGLCFDVLAQVGDEKVVIGHSAGVITIDLSEADPVHRERQRCFLNESYRTMLGHVRHEVGHYFFDRLIAPTSRLAAFRDLFGDERQDYQQALQAHYAAAPAGAWEDRFVTRYAQAHPWEDWAESWAHYMHTTATAETAHCHGLNAASDELVEAQRRVLACEEVSREVFDQFMQSWSQTAVMLNELNRSMGTREAYPFMVRQKVTEKLYFIHQTIALSAHSSQ